MKSSSFFLCALTSLMRSALATRDAGLSAVRCENCPLECRFLPQWSGQTSDAFVAFHVDWPSTTSARNVADQQLSKTRSFRSQFKTLTILFNAWTAHPDGKVPLRSSHRAKLITIRVGASGARLCFAPLPPIRFSVVLYLVSSAGRDR
jgi:hypothetical protein